VQDLLPEQQGITRPKNEITKDDPIGDHSKELTLGKLLISA
jgi:hypothetical protein